jgi:hypothetical protein
MREVIRIPETNCKEDEPVKITHEMYDDGWLKATFFPENMENLYYMGKCTNDGDMFFRIFGVWGDLCL